MDSDKQFIGKLIIGISIPVILAVLFFWGLTSFARFQVNYYSSDEAKASAAAEALMPELAPYIERNGLRGFQDIDNQIETVKPDSGRTSVLPLDFSSIGPDSQKNDWIWVYSIYEYRNGSCLSF